MLCIPALRKFNWFTFWWNHIYLIILNDVYVYLLFMWLLWSCVAEWLERLSPFPSGHLLLLKMTTQLVDSPSDFSGAELQNFFWCPGLDWGALLSHTHPPPTIYVRGHNDDCLAFTSACQPNNNNHLLQVMTVWINPDSPIWGLVYKQQHSPWNLGSILLSTGHVVELIMVVTVTAE